MLIRQSVIRQYGARLFIPENPLRVMKVLRNSNYQFKILILWQLV